ATLFYEPGYKRIERAPRHRPGRASVDALHIGVPRPQAADVYANAAAARHDLHHLRKRVDDASPRVTRGGHDVAVVKSQLLICPGGGEDPARGHELPTVQQPSKVLIPLVGSLAFDSRDPARDPLHHLFGLSLDRLGHVLGQAFDPGAVIQLDGDAARV